MLITKEDAVVEVSKHQPNYKNIDRVLLKDKDVVRAYMQAHSSNRLLDLNNNFPITLDVAGLINDQDFILEVINNLDNGYNQDDLVYLLKFSTARIIQTRYDIHNSVSKEILENSASSILIKYRDAVVEQNSKLAKKKQVVDEVFDFIRSSRILDNIKSNDEKIIDKLTQVFDLISSHLALPEDEKKYIDNCMSDIGRLLKQNAEHKDNFEKYVNDNLHSDASDRYTRNEIGFK